MSQSVGWAGADRLKSLWTPICCAVSCAFALIREIKDKTSLLSSLLNISDFLFISLTCVYKYLLNGFVRIHGNAVTSWLVL